QSCALPCFRCQPGRAGPAGRGPCGCHLSRLRGRLSRDARGNRDRGKTLLPRRGRQAPALPRLPERGPGLHPGPGRAGCPPSGGVAMRPGGERRREGPPNGRNRTCPRLEIGSGPPISSIRAPQITEIKQANRESHTIDMTQGPDNNRPEPYFSDRQPGEGAGPGPEAPASSFGAAQGNAPGSAYPRAGSQAAPEPTPAPAGGGTGSGQAAPAGAMPGAGQSEGDQHVGEAAAGQAGDPAALEALKAELAEAQARAAATHEQLLRALAENENIRRRAQEEIAKARKFAIEAFAESLLPVIDSLELALKVEAPTVESIREGVEATLRLMVSAFEKNQLVGIDPAGQKFDPNHHQAI